MKWSAIVFICGGLVGYSAYPLFDNPPNIDKKLEKIDEIHYEIFEETRHANDIISSSISDGTIRLHVRTDSETTAGMDDGQRTRCNIHAADARRIIEVTKRADECSARLTALQEWVLEHTR